MINVGGITEWMKVAALAQAHNRPITSHGYDEIHVHLLAAAPSSSFVEYHLFRLDDYLCESLPLVNGCLQAPDTPGHGVRFDLRKARATATLRVILNRQNFLYVPNHKY